MVVVWDWKKGKILASTRGHTDRVRIDIFNLNKMYLIVLTAKRILSQ